jgi:hypothetical protein
VACLSDAPLRHLAGPSLGAALTPVREAWLGLGPRCRGYTPGCYTADFGRLPPTARLLRAWRATLAACLRVPALEQPAPVQPLRLLLVDRPEQESRWAGGPAEPRAAKGSPGGMGWVWEERGGVVCCGGGGRCLLSSQPPLELRMHSSARLQHAVLRCPGTSPTCER